MNLKEEVKDILISTAESNVSMATELILDGVFGTVVPGVVNSVLAYKQKRSEKMYLAFIQELKNRIDELEHNLQNMKKENYSEMKEKYFGYVSDYVLNEVQEEKIKYLASGQKAISTNIAETATVLGLRCVLEEIVQGITILKTKRLTMLLNLLKCLWINTMCLLKTL